MIPSAFAPFLRLSVTGPSAEGFSRAGRVLALALALLIPFGSRTEGAVIQSFNVGGTAGGNAQDPGIRLTTPVGGPWTNITFNWYQTSTGASYAIGTLFLLSQEYLSTPQALSSSTPGYLGSAAGNGTLYTFNSAITLQGNTQYYFYADLGLTAAASTLVSSSTGDSASNLSYGAANGTGNFSARASFDISYSLNGTPPAVPDRSATALLLLFPCALVFRRHVRGLTTNGVRP